MKTIALATSARRFFQILAALAAAAGFSSCTTGPMEHPYCGSSYGHASPWGTGEGHGRDSRSGRGAHSDHGGVAGRDRADPGASDVWIGPLPWPGDVRPDSSGPGLVGATTSRSIDPAIAGSLRRGTGSRFDSGRTRPDTRLTDSVLTPDRIRVEPRPSDYRLSPAATAGLRDVVSPGALRTSVVPAPRPSDLRLDPAAAAHLRTVNPIPAASVRPAATLRVNPEIRNSLRTGGVVRLRP